MDGNFVKMRNRAGVNLPSRVEPHIYRLPPSSIFTRKKERVSEADILWNVRPEGAGSDPTRLNENIRYYAKGINPSVEVEYQNHGSAGSRTTALHQNQVGSAYKLDVVRPPLFPVETLHSLSNPRTHQTHAVETNPGLPNGIAGNTLAYDYDMVETGVAVQSARAGGPITVQATAYYKLDVPSVMSARYAINENRRDSYEMMTNPGKSIDTVDFVNRETTPYGVIVRPTYSITSNLQLQGETEVNSDASGKVRKEILFQNIRPNFNIVVYDPSTHISTEVSANIREKNHIAAQAAIGAPITLNRDDGTQIKLKDSLWTAVNTNVGIDQLILTIQDPNIQLERNLPLYATSTGLTMPGDVTEHRNQEFDLEGKVAAFSQPTMNLSSYYDQENLHEIQGRTRIDKQTFNTSFDNQGSARPRMFQRDLPRLRNTSMRREAATQHYDRLFE